MILVTENNRLAVEQDRSRIARDIHDGLGADISQIIADAREAQAVMKSEAEGPLTRLRQSADAAASTIDELVWIVSPKDDTVESLATFTSEFAAAYLHANHITCQLHFPLKQPRMTITAAARHNLYFAFKEALHNIVKHAKADVVTITMSLFEGFVEFEIADNGCGFLHRAEVVSVTNRGGHGLENMRVRVLEVGGDFFIESSLGNGTKIHFRLPLPQSRRI